MVKLFTTEAQSHGGLTGCCRSGFSRELLAIMLADLFAAEAAPTNINITLCSLCLCGEKFYHGSCASAWFGICRY